MSSRTHDVLAAETAHPLCWWVFSICKYISVRAQMMSKDLVWRLGRRARWRILSSPEHSDSLSVHAGVKTCWITAASSPSNHPFHKPRAPLNGEPTQHISSLETWRIGWLHKIKGRFECLTSLQRAQFSEYHQKIMFWWKLERRYIFFCVLFWWKTFIADLVFHTTHLNNEQCNFLQTTDSNFTFFLMK